MRETFSVRIQGTKPYLMNAFKGEVGGSARKGANPTPEEDCENALYRTSEKRIYVPSIQVWASIRDASKEFKLKGLKSYWQTVNSSVFVEPEELILSPQTFTPFLAGVVIGDARVMKARPRFENWSLEFRLVNTEERLREHTLKEILQEAGQRRGIGDWRPRFGTYEIAGWEKLELVRVVA